MSAAKWADLKRLLGSKAVGMYVSTLGWAPMDVNGQVALRVFFMQPAWDPDDGYKPATMTPDLRPTDGEPDVRLLVKVMRTSAVGGGQVAAYWARRDGTILTVPGLS